MGVPPKRRATIVDVARRAGVSVATVSKVLNDRYGVAPETHSKVRQIIDRMGYSSSLGASSLRSRITHVIGVLVTEIEPFSAELLKGISRAASRDGNGSRCPDSAAPWRTA
jgi:LacI family transcriptional regulator